MSEPTVDALSRAASGDDDEDVGPPRDERNRSYLIFPSSLRRSARTAPSAAFCRRHVRRGGFGCVRGSGVPPLAPRGDVPVRRALPVRASRRRSSGGRERRRRDVREGGSGAQPSRAEEGKCGHLRRFLIDTFGAETLRRGPVLDVGGGRGELAFELENLNDVRCVVVDAVPLRLEKLAKKLRGGWYHRTAPLQRYNDAPAAAANHRGEDHDHPGADDRGARRPAHWRVLWTPDLWAPAAEGGERTPPSPRAWRCIARGRRREWFDSETRARTTPKTAREESPERFARWPSAPTRRRKRRASPVTGMSRVFPGDGDVDTPSDPPGDGDVDDTGDAVPACDCGDESCGSAPPDADAIRAALRDCSAVVGLHSDHATEWIVDFALERGIPFAVVPCCVCPGSFPHRRLRGAPVSTHDDFVEYLVSKAPEEIRGCPARVRREGSRGVLDVGGNEGGSGEEGG